MSIKKNNTYFQEDNGKVYYYDENGERKNVPNSAFGTLKDDLESTSAELADTIETTSGILHGEIDTASGNLQEQIDNIGSPLTYSGTKTVDEINALENIKQGTVYTMSNSGTITAGNIDVEQSDEIAYANEWVKIGKDLLYSDYYKKTETSGKEELENKFITKLDIDNIDVGPNNLKIVKENKEVQNIHCLALTTNGQVEDDITSFNVPFNWYIYRDNQGNVLPSTIKFTFAHNLDYYDSIIIEIDDGSPTIRTPIELKGKNVGDIIANWYNYTPISIYEIGENYITIKQDNSGPSGYFYSITTTPNVLDKIVISTNEMSCYSENNSIVFGIKSSAFGKNNIAVGEGVLVSGQYSQAFGYGSKALESECHAEGHCTVAKRGGHAEGCQTSAFGSHSHAEGFESFTDSYYNNGGWDAHAEGWRTSAINHAHSEGYETIASANESRGITHAEGYKTSAFITVTYPFAAAHSEGNSTIASGLDSHAEGRGTSAIGNCSHSEGCGTIAGSESMHAGGKYNKTSSDALFVIGNGTNNNNRSDAFIVSSNGYVSAKRFVESDPISVLDPSAVHTYDNVVNIGNGNSITSQNNEMMFVIGYDNELSSISSTYSINPWENGADNNYVLGNENGVYGNYQYVFGYGNYVDFTNTNQRYWYHKFNNFIVGNRNSLVNGYNNFILGDTNNIITPNESEEAIDINCIIGYNNKISEYAYNSLIIGWNNSAKYMDTSIVLGYYNYTDNLDNSLILGQEHILNDCNNSINVGMSNTITESANLVIGESNSAENYTLTIGSGNSAEYFALAVGSDNSALTNSLALGGENIANTDSLAVGDGNEAEYSVAIIESNTAKDYSIAVGLENDADYYGQAFGNNTIISGGMAIGQFNKTSANVAFVIGNGTTAARSDLFIVSADGTVSAKRFVEAEPDTSLQELITLLHNKPATGNKYIIGLDEQGTLTWVPVT
jgi:hypothetical protein